MTHIANISHIVQNGITHMSSDNSNPEYTPIGDKSVISSRNSILLANGKSLGDYIPFYFAVRTPMLYVMQKGFNNVRPIPAENIVYCISSVQKIIDHSYDFIFTDGHAVNVFSSVFYPYDIINIHKILDFEAIKAQYWSDEADLDKKRRKEAEFLVAEDIQPSAILGFAVQSDLTKNHLINIGIESSKIIIKPEYYF